MNIKLKMGAKASLPSSVDSGTVYFAKDGDKNFGELYYGDANGNKVKIGGTTLSSINFNNTGVITLSFEDGTSVTGTLPVANEDIYGIINNTTQSFKGIKTFTDEIIVSKISFITSGNIESTGDGISIYDNHLWIGNGGFHVNVTSADNPATLTLEAGSGLWTESLGNNLYYIPAAFIEEIYSSSIRATQFKGAFVGDLEGHAKDAYSWTNAILLNGTEVKGGEIAEIITAKWGAERNISISDSAGTTGTVIDGSAEDGYTLIIPSTMTNFTSITSTNLLATNLGAAGTPIVTSHFKDTYFHNPNNNNYKHKLTSNAGSVDCELQLPNTSGLIVTKASLTAAVGGLNAPVFVAASGEVTACSTISVEHGGTGSNSLSAYSLLYGNGTNAVGQITPMAAGRILVSGGTTSAPLYASPSLSFSTGTSNPTISFVINGATYTSTNGIQSATGENPGIVTTTSQTFAGAKTFTGAATFNAGITSTTGTFSSQINATSIKLSGQLKSHSAGRSYLTLTDTKATIASPTIYLNGKTIVLNSNNYGATLPIANNNADQIFFLEDNGVLITTNYGTTDPNSSTKGYDIEGALYFKILED